MKLKRYLLVAKPGIIFGNLIAVVGGCFLAARGGVEPMLLLAIVVSLSLVVANGCMLNNCVDRDIGRHMERTCGRVTVTGQIPLKTVLVRGLVLGVAGFGLLRWRTNPPITALADFGYLVYVNPYSLQFRRRSQYGTPVGSLSGAISPMVGYCTVSGQFNTGATSLLVILCLWQIPYSYAIAIFRLKDYEMADIPVLPVTRGIATTKTYIVLYILAFTTAILILCLGDYAGYGYLLMAVVVSLWWLAIALTGYWTTDDRVWVRKLFILSIVAITMLNVMMSTDFQMAPATHLVASLL